MQSQNENNNDVISLLPNFIPSFTSLAGTIILQTYFLFDLFLFHYVE